MKKLLALLAFIPSLAFAQTIPFLNNQGLIDTSKWYISNNIVNGASWNACTWMTGNAVANPHENEVDLVISQNPKNTCGCELPTPYVCGELQTQATFSYGTYSAHIKTSNAKGTNTAFFTYTMYPHDEIDFEFLPKNPMTVSVNWWVNGQSSPVNGKSIWGHVVNLGFDPSLDYHDYAFTWTPTSITWFVDGKKVWSTPVGANIPTHKQKIYIDHWASGPDFYPWMGHLTYTAPLQAGYRDGVTFTPYDLNASIAPEPATVTAPVAATTPASVMRPVGAAR